MVGGSATSLLVWRRLLSIASVRFFFLRCSIQYSFNAILWDHLLRALRAIEMFPEIGSADIPETTRERYGTAVRKMAIRPFDLVYEYDRESDVVYVHALIPFRQVR